MSFCAGTFFTEAYSRDRESKRRLAHRDYEAAFYAMRAEWSPEELAEAISKGYDQPLPYDGPQRRAYTDDEEFRDPADRAIDDRIPIVDFESTTQTELQAMCDRFRRALVWATRRKKGRQPDLTQMGVRMLTIFALLQPQLKVGMDMRIPKTMTLELSQVVGNEPIYLGRFFRHPLAWVRKCTSLVQLGKRGYSMTYVLCGDLIDSATCAAIGFLDNKSRQAANKPIQDFRDNFVGIKSLPMRGSKTRKRCKQSQEKN